MHHFLKHSVINLCLTLVLEFIPSYSCNILLCILFISFIINELLGEKIDFVHFLTSLLLICLKIIPIPNNGFWMRIVMGQLALFIKPLMKIHSEIYEVLLLGEIRDMMNRMQYNLAKSSGCPGH